MSDLTELRDKMRRFTDEREWHHFHDPKSLILAMLGELGELAELFQWLPAEEAAAVATQGRRREAVADELADVLLYLVRLSDVLEVDLYEAAMSKTAKNEAKHPRQK